MVANSIRALPDRSATKAARTGLSGAASASQADGYRGCAHVGQPALPGERMRDDGIEVVEFGRPAELPAQAAAVGDNRRRVAGAAARKPHGKIAAAHALDRVDHGQNGTAVPVAAVEG